MPWTLYRYILRELLKVLVLTTAVLVVVLSFGAAIGPMSDGLLGPASLLKFVGYTMPTVLGFALPFAGAFSATVVFHAMAKDNEVLACRAGGMSYRRIFAPVAMTGFVLMLAMLLLSNTVVPGFWKAAKRTVEGDVLAILVSRLNQNRPYIFGSDGLVLYADAAAIRPTPEGARVGDLVPEQYIEMTGVAFGQYDQASGQVLNDTTASAAGALLVRDPISDRAYLTVRLRDPVFYDARTDEVRTDLGRFGEVETDQPILLPNPIQDDAVFLTFNDLMRLKNNPHEFDIVRGALSDLSAAVTRQQLEHLIVNGLSPERGGQGFVVLRGGLASEFYRVTSPVVEPGDGGLILRADADWDPDTPSAALPITIDRYTNPQLLGEPVRRFEAAAGQARVQSSRFSREPEVRITLRGVRVLALNASDPPNNKQTQDFAPMAWTEPVLGVDPATLTATQLGDWSRRAEIEDAQAVKQARNWLAFRIIQLKQTIDAELYTRLATALATPLLLVLGALLAVRFRDQPPLAVFFWAFLLAIVTLVMIYTGQNMAAKIDLQQYLAGTNWDRHIGVLVLWGGDLILLLVIARFYLRVART